MKAPAWNRSERPEPPLATLNWVAPPASAKPRYGVGREPVVGADRGCAEAAGGCVRSQRRIAVGGLRSAEAGRPHAPAWIEQWIAGYRLGDHAVSVALGARALAAVGSTGVALFGKRARARSRQRAIAAAAEQRIGHHAHELRHRVECGLLRSGRGLARSLRQVLRDVAGQDRAEPAGCNARRIKGGVECRADGALVGVQPRDPAQA